MIMYWWKSDAYRFLTRANQATCHQINARYMVGVERVSQAKRPCQKSCPEQIWVEVQCYGDDRPHDDVDQDQQADDAHCRSRELSQVWSGFMDYLRPEPSSREHAIEKGARAARSWRYLCTVRIFHLLGTISQLNGLHDVKGQFWVH